jgi:3-oxoacyl-[acyl-carrier protein] reductase
MGLVGLTRTLSKEWGRYRVNVNAVAFGVIRTRLTQVLDTGEASINVEGQDIRVGVHSDTMAAWERAIPLGRAGSPEEAAGAVYLLCTPEANYITGEILVCGGGLRI